MDMFLQEEGQSQIVISDQEIEACECEDTMIFTNEGR